MTAHISKEQLALMLPGTMYHYFKDEPEYVAARPQPRRSLLARIGEVLAGWIERDIERQELAGLTDRQLADIGVSRAEAARAFDPDFAAVRHRDRLTAALQTGRVAVGF